MHYEIDRFVHEEHSEDEINVSCVCSWKIVDKRSTREVDVNFRNSWVFNSYQRGLSPSQADLVIKELFRVRG